jgi:hypothetical protein
MNRQELEEERRSGVGEWKSVIDSLMERELQLVENSTQEKIRKNASGIESGAQNDIRGKSWVEMKLELEFVVQNSSIFDLVPDTREAPTTADMVHGFLKIVSRDVLVSIIQTLCSEHSPLAGVLSLDCLKGLAEKAVPNDTVVASTGDAASVSRDRQESNKTALRPLEKTILMTSDALKWNRHQKDPTLRHKFAARLEQLAGSTQRERRSYCEQKPLKGGTRHAMETKLDAGDRIIWTENERENTILVWYVCKHKVGRRHSRTFMRCINTLILNFLRYLLVFNSSTSTVPSF